MYHPVSQKGAGALVVPPVLFGQNTTQPESEMYCWRLLLQIQASMQSQGTARWHPTRAVTFIVPFTWWEPCTESAARRQLMKGRPAPPPCSSTEAAGARLAHPRSWEGGAGAVDALERQHWPAQQEPCRRRLRAKPQREKAPWLSQLANTPRLLNADTSGRMLIHLSRAVKRYR